MRSQTPRRRHLLFIALPSALLVACTEGGPSLCDQAADHLRSCFGDEVALSASCTDADAQEVLEKDCDALARSKSDGLAGFMCSVFGLFCPTCADLGGVCLASPDGASATADCSADWGTESVDAQCAVAGETCCAPPFGCDQYGACLIGAENNVGFVDSASQIHFMDSGALKAIALAGGTATTVLDPGVGGIRDVSDDARTIALEDSETRLYVSRDGQQPVQVDDVGPLTGEVAVSPDGQTVAITLHPDFSEPQEQWQDTDSVWLIDSHSLVIDVLEGQEVDGPPLQLAWSSDSQDLLMYNFDFSHQRISASDGSRTPGTGSWPPPDIRRKPFWSQQECAADERALVVHDEGAIDIVTPGEAARRIVEIRGFVPSPPAVTQIIYKAVFSPDCDYVIFDFDEQLWVADSSTGRVGLLHAGYSPFVLPQ